MSAATKNKIQHIRAEFQFIIKDMEVSVTWIPNGSMYDVKVSSIYGSAEFYCFRDLNMESSKSMITRAWSEIAPSE